MVSESTTNGRGGTRYLAGAVAYVAFVSVLSHIPGTIISRLGGVTWDKAAHFIEFAPLGFLLFAGLSRSRPDRPRWETALIGVVLIAVVSIGDEIHQMFVPFRSCTVGDALADVLGGAVGAFIARMMLTRKVNPSLSRTT